MKRFKRAAAAILAAAMSAASVFALTGCFSDDEDETKSADSGDLIELTVFSERANMGGEQTGWMAQILAEKFGVKLTIVQDTGNTLTTMMEDGNLGDLIVWGYGDDYIECAKQGLLYDWETNDMLQTYAPYVWENLQVDLQHNATLTEDGKIYGLQGNVGSDTESIDAFFYNWDLRFDLYAELGYPEINDLDDLYDVLVAMKELYPTNEAGQEVYAISSWPDWDGDMVMYVKCLAQAYYGMEGDFVLGLYDVTDGTYHDPLEEDGPYLEMVRFCNKLYRAGLWDPDSATQTWSDASAKVSSGRVLFSLFNYAGSLLYNTEENLANGTAMYSVCPTEATSLVYGLSTYGTESQMFSIGAKSEYPDLCLEIINWMFTPEGRLTTEYGPEGLCWYYDENNNTCFTALGRAVYLDKTLTLGDLYQDVTDEETGEVTSVLVYEVAEEYLKYCGQTFSDGSNQMNIVTWNLMEINPESGEPYNYNYWYSETVEPEEGSINALWRSWAGEGVVTQDDYLKTTDYATKIACSYDTRAATDDDFKTLWKQVTAVIVDGTYKAIKQDTEAGCEAAIQEMIDTCYAYQNGEGYLSILEYCEEECAKKLAAENEVRAANAENQ